MYLEMSAPEMISACGNDADKWAAAFCERFPAVPQDEAMGWFANAMMTMWDVTNSAATHDDTALADHISALVRNRDLWRDLGADDWITPDPAESSLLPAPPLPESPR